jgi:DNA polymerase III alpha subunit
MGFYAPAQIVRDAREHGVEVRPVCVNRSAWDNTMERTETGDLALRLGFRQIKSMPEEEAEWLIASRQNGYRDVEDVWRRAGLEARTLTILAEADAFADLGISRRKALWAARALSPKKELPLFSGDLDGEAIFEAPVTLPEMSAGEHVVEDYVAMRLTLRQHPVALIRDRLSPNIDKRLLRGGLPPRDASQRPNFSRR